MLFRSNHSTLYSIDAIENAINNNTKLAFRYFDLDHKGNKVLRRNGGAYVVNPIATVFSNDNYYLVCFTDKFKNYSNYRIDRMEQVKSIPVERMESPLITNFDISEYRKQSFGMFTGKTEKITLEFDATLIDVMFDKFGESIKIQKTDDKYTSTVKAIASEQFYGWLLGLGTRIKVTKPESIVQGLKDYVQSIAELY